MMYNCNGKIKTDEQVITIVWNKFINNAYREQRNARKKKEMIAELIDEIEYVNYFNQNDVSAKDKALYDLLRKYQIQQDVFNDDELNDLFSIIESLEIIRN